MDFQYTPGQEAFRSEVRSWLEAQLPPELCVDDAFDERVAPDRDTFERRLAWQKKMSASRGVGISWPEEYGGRAASLMEPIIFDEEYVRSRALWHRLLGRLVAEYGTLCHGDAGHGGGHRRRRGLMLAILRHLGASREGSSS